MKAAFLYAPRDVRIEEAPIVTPGPGDVLLNVTAVGVCGSDLHTYLHGQVGDISPESPLILGHEAAGVIAALGPGTESTFKVGQHVAIDPAIHCGECERCLEGNPNLCTRLVFIGLWPQHGAMREQMVHPAKSIVPLPPGIDDVSAALLEPLGVALHAIKLAKIKVGDDVVVIGCGAIGLLLIRLARLSGAKHIYASDRFAWRLDLAKRYGADFTINITQDNVVDYVQHATKGRGVDIAIESAWVTDTANQCMEVARNGGRVVIVGIPVEDHIGFRAGPARRKGLTVKLSRRMKHTYPASIELAASGQVALGPLASHRFSLQDTGKALATAADYADSVVRAMVIPCP